MKKIHRSFFVLLLTFGSAQAEIAYVTDDFNLSLRSEASGHGRALKSLPTGTSLTVIGKPTKTGFIRVRLIDGTEGYIKTRYLKNEPPAHDAADTASKNLALLQAENIALKAELASVKASITPGTSLEQSLATERDQLSRELNDLKKTAANTVQLKSERDELQERVVNVERDLQQFKLENDSLKNTAKQDWFLYGGLLSLFGVILGFILPKLSWRRKSSWDSY